MVLGDVELFGQLAIGGAGVGGMGNWDRGVGFIGGSVEEGFEGVLDGFGDRLAVGLGVGVEARFEVVGEGDRDFGHGAPKFEVGWLGRFGGGRGFGGHDQRRGGLGRRRASGSCWFQCTFRWCRGSRGRVVF